MLEASDGASSPDSEGTFSAGRSCPLSYRYQPTSLAALRAKRTDTLYCVGGLYGNAFALDALEHLLQEERNETRVVFNGDFHWFDASADAFAYIEARTTSDSRYLRLRGNVETEIASDDDQGCGCGYPDAVDDGTVERSNEILRILRAASFASPSRREHLAALDMAGAFLVGAQRVVVVHGDLESLAGWRLDPGSLDDPKHAQWAAQSMREANADIVASSHTCLPALRRISIDDQARTVVNNGAAGMPCFAQTRFGIVTRIATEPASAIGLKSLYGERHADVWVEAIALRFDFDAWRTQFLALWPEGSSAHRSYFPRIEHGTNFTVSQALGRAA